MVTGHLRTLLASHVSQFILCPPVYLHSTKIYTHELEVVIKTHVCILLMATWMDIAAERKSWDQLSCPMLNSVMWPSNKIMPACALPRYARTTLNRRVFLYPPAILPIERLWNVLDWHICQQVAVPQNSRQLQVALLEEFDNLSGHDWQPGDVHALQVNCSARG